MAKTWQYSRWRRVVMQVTLGVILAATVGLAALVTRQRSREARIELSATPTRVGVLEARFPKGWETHHEFFRRTSRHTVEATDPDPTNQRRLAVVQESLESGTTPAQFVARYARLKPDDEFERFDFLGQRGEGVEVFGGRQDETGAIYPVTQLFAATILPPAGKGERATGVMIKFEANGVLGPSARRLMREIADSIRFVGPAPTTRASPRVIIRESRPPATAPAVER